MRTIALIEKGKDGSFGIFTPDLHHTIIGDGVTVTKAKEDFYNSVHEVIASYTEMGKQLPVELKQPCIKLPASLPRLSWYK